MNLYFDGKSVKIADEGKVWYEGKGGGKDKTKEFN